MSKLAIIRRFPATIAVFGLIFATGSTTFAQNYTGCLKANGKLKKLLRGAEPVRTCKIRETEIHLASEDTTNAILDSIETVTELAASADGRLTAVEAEVERVSGLVDGKILVDGALGNTALGNATFPSERLVFNTAIGARALESLRVPGQGNTAIGAFTLQTTPGGFFNTAIGYQALRLLQEEEEDEFNPNTARDNIAVGHLAGSQLRRGRYNIYVGHSGESFEDGTIRIGDAPFQKSAFIAGVAGTNVSGSPVLVTDSGQLGVEMSSRRYKTDIEPMGAQSDGLLRLRPVSFHYKQADVAGKQRLEYGLIAEEVAEVYPELVGYSDDGKPQTVRYHKLNSMLLNELQKQHQQLIQQERIIADLTARLSRVEARVTRN